MQLAPSLTRKNNPLRYWIFVVYAIGIPNFIQFDTTGRTHNEGLFNLTSIGSIALALTTGFLLASMVVLNRQKFLQRSIDVAVWLWVLLLADMAIASFLEPRSQLTPFKATDLPLSVYRMCEWVLAFVLLLSLYTRERAEEATDFVIRVIGIVCWANIIMVWIALPVARKLVYGAAGDSAEQYPRLGGQMVHPVHLAVMAGIAFFYSLLFTRGAKQYAGCLVAAATLALTYARSEQIVFLLALVLYVLVLSRSTLLRWGSILGGLTGVALLIVFQERVLKYLARGQGARNITTLSERTLVWQASFRAIAERPWIGYGYIAGAKNALKDQWNATNWVPPHAHSEVIQALLSGGVPAAAAIVSLYALALWCAFKGARRGSREIFLLIVLVQIALMAVIMPLVTVQYSRLSGIFMMSFVAVVAGQRVHAARRAIQRPRPRAVPELAWAEPS